MSTSSIADHGLKKLTVPQLKALCKERRITGYSKLGKSAIIQKLIEHNTHLVTDCAASTTAVPEIVSSRAVPASDQTTVLTLASRPDNITTTSHVQGQPKINAKNFSPKNVKNGTPNEPMTTPSAQLTQASDDYAFRNNVPSSVPPAFVRQNLSSERAAFASAVGSKRPYVGSPGTVQEPAKKKVFQSGQGLLSTQVTDTSNRQSPAGFNVPAGPKVVNCQMATAPPTVTPRGQNHIDMTTQAPQTSENHAQTSGLTAKRFIPLAVKKSTLPLATGHVLSGAASGNRTLVCTLHPTKVNAGAMLTLNHLDFILTPTISLASITLPPSLSHRRLVEQYAVLLSGISAEDLGPCTLVSRMFRYAAYLSAGHRLKRCFHGKRLAIVMYQYAQNMTNMWPYLRQREHELLSRKQKYHKSFLANVFKCTNPIEEHLWTSPDHEKQITIAVRFLLTRLWFLVSIGGGKGSQAWNKDMIIDAQELVKDEIWTIKIRNSLSAIESFYVLEPTCEVVGHPAPSLHSADSPSDFNTPASSLPLRADWSAYITHRLLPSSLHDSPPLPLLHHLNWTNHEEYDKGISRLWLKKVEGEGELGAAKRIVGERYILACVVGNSVSGRWMSSTEMAQDYSGLPSSTASLKPKIQRVHLFLPAHHHIESLHFTGVDGKPLHSALAVVQTPGREYYILKDNGMQVGCEEDGVANVWQQLLGCNSLGYASELDPPEDS